MREFSERRQYDAGVVKANPCAIVRGLVVDVLTGSNLGHVVL
jgi:hypothetical protein